MIKKFLFIAGLLALFLFDDFLLWLLAQRLELFTFLQPVGLAALGAILVLNGLLVAAVVRILRKPPVTGREGLIGERGVALSEIGPALGQVSVHGEIWQARSSRPISKGTPVVVEGLQGLTLLVSEISSGRPQRPGRKKV